MNRVAKGQRFELLIKNYLISVGYYVEKAPSLRFRHDFFGCVDLIAFHPSTRKMLFIQATASNKNIAKKLKEMDALETPTYIQKIIVVKERGNKCSVFQPSKYCPPRWTMSICYLHDKIWDKLLLGRGVI